MDEWTLNDLLECSVCLERLDTSSKVLPCQHTFCKKCLEEIVSTHKELRCPECRVLVNSKIEDLPPNVLLMRILEGMKNAAPKKRNTAPNRMLGGSFTPQTPIQHLTPVHHSAVVPSPAHPSPKQTITQINQPYARAMYDYIAKEPGDLSFKKGDIIILRKKIDTNWYQGESGGNFGAFPLTYVQVISPLPSQIPQCKALYDFRMTNDDEEGCLTFNKGEIITVLRRVDENWAEGRLGERIGIFPLAFVELNIVARALMKLSTNAQPGPSRVAPPTPTSEDTTPLIPTDHTFTVAPQGVNTTVVSTHPTPQPQPHPQQNVPAAPLPHQHVTMGTSDSSSTVSSGSSSTTTPNTSSSNTSSSSSTAPSSPTSPPPPRPAHNPTISPPHAPQHRDKRHSFSVLHTGHHHQTSHRHSAEILSPTESSAPDSLPPEHALQVGGSSELVERQGSQRHRRSGSSDLGVGPPPPPQGAHHLPGSTAHLPAAYIALYPYKPQKPDELELRKGGIYVVTERCQDGWFKGTSNRTQKCGVFPGNYVTPAKALPGVQAQVRGLTRGPPQQAGPVSPRSSNGAVSYTRGKHGPATLPYTLRQHNGVGSPGSSQLSQAPPELPPRSTSPSLVHNSAVISSSWHGQQQLQPSSDSATPSSIPLGRSHSAVMTTSMSSAPQEATPSRSMPHVPSSVAPPPNTVIGRDKTKEKRDKGVSLMRRLTSMKKSKSPPPATYSMDNPVFEDGSIAGSPAHPVHVRSGSCPSQLLQVLPPDHRLFGSGSQRLKHKDRPNVVMANLTHFASRPSDTGSACSTSTNHHRKSNSLDAGSSDPTRKTSKQLVPPVRERFRCIVPYPPNSEYELELQVGDIIYVHKKRDDGWYKGTQQRTGRTGLFPASFVETF
ncbi:E3 ubiquitin-protein ligase SH3RF3 [Anabrus simplex]|uniref:E3 ubiquitin-protein ligase SH3RF3 n=1 Tax=Anabrus simplex TaxID=316456 RepID=UPI0035A391D8